MSNYTYKYYNTKFRPFGLLVEEVYFIALVLVSPMMVITNGNLFLMALPAVAGWVFFGLLLEMPIFQKRGIVRERGYINRLICYLWAGARYVNRVPSPGRGKAVVSPFRGKEEYFGEQVKEVLRENN